jgi:hypothetical protein
MADYGNLQDDADAVLDLLYAIGPTLSVYPAAGGGAVTVPNGTPPPYATVHFAVGRPLGGRLPARSTRQLTRIYVHCVGGDDIAARAVSVLVAGALLDVKPAITGRTCFPIRHESHQPPREDESTGVLTVTLTEVYRLESLPGTGGS